MDTRMSRDVVRRWRDNPLVALEDVPFRCSDVWNAGVARLGEEYLLLITIEELQGLTSIYRARSRDGRNFTIEPGPFMTPSANGEFAVYETLGIRDPRITALGGTHYITYVAESDHGLRLGLARTDDFVRVERMGLVTQVDWTGGALFPEKIGGRYVLLERPNPGNSIWISYSDDLEFWGASTVVMTPRGGYWDPDRVGPAAPPVRIKEGWLLVYYGEKHASSGPLVRLGVAVLDSDDPSRVIARGNIPILSPREKYERVGDVGNVVFSCGMVVEDNGEVKLYYGASDSCICLGTVTVDELLDICRESGEEF